MSRALDRPRSAPSAHAVLAGAALLVGAVVLSCCTVDRRAGEDILGYETEGDFYELPVPLPAGDPGTIIRSERLLGAPNGAIAWRVLYLSTDVHGTPVGVSGVVVAPDGPSRRGGRPVVSWAHPTTGATGKCAPSVGLDPFVLIEGLDALLDEGYVVAATDYPGMGADGPPSYLIGTSEGNSVLDAARAARSIPEAQAGDELLLWGHSQGGQAALFAAQDATTYAPELDLLGVAVAAPAVELGQLLEDDLADASGVTLGSYAFDAYEHVYSPDDPTLELSSILTPAGVAAVPEIAPLCLARGRKEIHAIADPLAGKFVSADPATTEPWATLLRQNTPGAKPVGVPMLVAQGLSDELVHPATTDTYVRHLCDTGEQVEYRTYEGIDHGLVALRAVPLLIPWMAELVAGDTTADTCPPA